MEVDYEELCLFMDAVRRLNKQQMPRLSSQVIPIFEVNLKVCNISNEYVIIFKKNVFSFV